MVPVAPAESFETAGRGAPVVLIPGLFGSAFGFRKLVPLLVGAGYRTIVIEPLGVGASARPEKANYSLTAQADRIAAVLDSLHVRNALVLAHSIGGSEAFRLSYRRPDLVRGLLSIEGGPTERAITPAFKRALRFAAPHLSQIRCPVRLMVGGAHHDGDVGVSEVQLLARTLPAFVIDSVPAAGHFIQEEEPGAVLASVARLKTSVTAAHAAGSQ